MTGREAGPGLRAQDVYEAWAAAMDRQGRVLAPERRSWDLLPQQEKDLDADIAYALNQGAALARDESPPVECAICGDYSAGGVEVHESCLALLTRLTRDESPLDVIAKAYSDGYRSGLSNEVDDWNADAETIDGYGREYAARLAEPPS